MASQRDAFLMRDSSGNLHLNVVLTDPAQNNGLVVCTSFSTNRPHKEQTCIVQPGAHEFITGESVVMYGKAKLVVATFIDEQIARGQFVQKQPLDPVLWKEVCDGFHESLEAPVGLKQILKDQGL